MNRKASYIVTVVVLAIVFGVVYLLVGPDNTDTQNRSSSTPNELPASQNDGSDNTTMAGAYIDYTDTVIAETEGTKILFFHAPWCPQCRDLEADIQANAIPAGVTIVKVDYDSNQALRQEYGVTIQTTIVRIDDEGNLVEKFVAYENPSLSAIKENLL